MYRYTVYIYIYIYYMTGRAIQGDFPFEAGHITPTEGRNDTEAENGMSPHIA